MRLPFTRPVSLLVSALIFAASTVPTISKAQTYPIDCAILLCLAGGWPTSVPCTRARAEFIRRITPWPVEPPLQIWRCPMNVAYQGEQKAVDPVYDALFDVDVHATPQSFSAYWSNITPIRPDAVRTRPAEEHHHTTGQSDIVRLMQDHADIDISGPEFNFVRSIRVFDVRFVRQKESDNTGDCNRGERVLLGTYGIQGNFAWQTSSTAALPAAHSDLERYGEHCPELYHRSVFVEWRDYAGRYGFEQVNY